MKSFLAFCVICTSFSLSAGFAQHTVKSEADTAAYCVPSIEGLTRPKGILIREELVTNHSINSSNINDPSGTGQGKIRTLRRREIKLKAPLINKENFKLAIGFKYKVEDIFFEDQATESVEFFNNLEDKNLKQLGTTLYMVKPFRGNTYFLMRVSASLNGDYNRANSPDADYLKLSIAPLLGFKRTPYLSYAVGIGYSENFGRRSVFPLLSYNQTFTKHFGVESLLPLNVKFRYSSLNRKNFIFLSSEVQGTSYNITFANSEAGYLNNTELKYKLTYEREIYDFVWASVETGLNTTLYFSLSDTPDRRRSTVIDTNRKAAFFVGFSVFVVPPRKFIK